MGSPQQDEHPAHDNDREPADRDDCALLARGGPARGTGEGITLGLAVQVGDPGLRQIVVDDWCVSASPVTLLVLSRGCG